MTGFVLIHGGTTTGAYWDRLRPLLDHPSIAPDLPGRRDRPADLMTLTADEQAASLVADVEASDLAPPLVVFAHSSAGLVLPEVARRLGDRVSHLVMSSSSVPPEGGNCLDCMRPQHADGVRALWDDAVSNAKSVTTLDHAMDPDPERVRRSYGGDPLDDETLAFVTDPERRVPDSFCVYFSPVSWKGVPEVPITYLRNLRDKTIPLDLQDNMIARLPRRPRVVDLDGGHIPEVTHPETVAMLLHELMA